ncbi:MAG: hypothetical protein EOP19_13430 [Hyphomicrobiales bacterium]|nr:MAG: hypothetical protein EOP19_13430 [Hyphomicrobiales bacterium]
MIPLAQYFADSAGDDFTPFTPVRKATLGRKLEASTSFEDPSIRPLKSVPRPSEQKARTFTEARVPLSEVEAERAAWAEERAALLEAVEAAREEGIESGKAMAREELSFETESRIDSIRSEIANDYTTTLTKTRGEWTEDQADRLADLLILQMTILEETIKMSLNSVLRPLALDARRRQTLDDLVGAVKTIALDGMAYKIAASGPTDLLSAFEDKLGDHARLLSFANDDTQSDIRIDADSTVIETRLSSWRLALEEALS